MESDSEENPGIEYVNKKKDGKYPARVTRNRGPSKLTELNDKINALSSH